MGRPSDYTPEVALEICDWLRNGKSLASYCDQDDKPSFSTIYRWLDAQEEFREGYARAREVQAHNDADKLNYVAELLRLGVIASDVARVMTDAYKWTAGRRAPKAYGDRVALSGDNAGGPITISWEPPSKPE